MYTKNIIIVGNLTGRKFPSGIATDAMTVAQQIEVARYLFEKGRTGELTDKGAALFTEKVYLCDEQEPEPQAETEPETVKETKKQNVRTKK